MGLSAKRSSTSPKSLGLENRVCFSGLQADVSPFMQAADCLVIPSLWKEAVGLVILEAWHAAYQ